MNLFVRWLLSLSLAGAIAAFVTDGLGVLVARHVAEDSELTLRAAMLLTGMVEGAIFGAGQVWVLGPSLGVSRRRWIGHTVSAFLMAWMLGSLLSELEPSQPLSFAALLIVAGAAGMALGAVLGFSQGRLLKEAGHNPNQWMLVSAIGWGSALVIAALAADFVPWGAYGLTALLVSVTGGAFGGLAFALISWSTLRSLVLRP